MSYKRVSKKLVPNLADIDAAINQVYVARHMRK